MSVATEEIRRSSRVFIESVWPYLQKHLPDGELIPVETVTDVGFAKDLDVLAGIDAWHKMVIDGTQMLRGIACRVQYPSDHPAYPFKSFTIRCDIGGGRTEWHKRRAAILHADKGALYPHLTVQAYVGESEELLQYGIVRTRDLINVCESIQIWARRQLTNPADGNRFWPVWWHETPTAGTYRVVNGEEAPL